MTTVGDVLGWPLEHLAAVSALLGAHADRLTVAAAGVVAATDSDPEWHGATREAARSRAQVVRRSLQRTAAALDDAAGRTETARAAMESAQSALRAQVAAARSAGYRVAQDGTVSHPDRARRDDADYLGDRIAAILSLAVEADQTGATAIGAAAGRMTGTVGVVVLPDGGAGDAGAALAQLSRMSAADRRAYWESLTQSERDRMLADEPTRLGNLPGIPFTDRAAANRRAIEAALAREVAAGRGSDDKAVLLRSMLAVETRPDGSRRTRRFIAFDAAGDGRFVEMIGDIDEGTRNVATFVPGTGTGLDDVDTNRRRGQALHDRSGAPILIFADGVFPQKIATAVPWQVDETASAKRSASMIAPRLVAFTADLDAELATVAPGAATTVIGHSYGGSVVGTAEQLGMRADRVVYASSAGTGVLPDREWSNPEPDVKRYSLTPPGDPIHLSQSFGGFVHGGDPDAEPGVTRLDSGFSGPDESGRRRLLFGEEAHSAYLDDAESDGFAAIADVVAGREPSPYVDRAPDHLLPGSDTVMDLLRTAPGAVKSLPDVLGLLVPPMFR